MHQRFILLIGFGDVDVAEISQMNFNHAFSNVNVDDCFFVSQS